jgi:hypothetical protein
MPLAALAARVQLQRPGSASRTPTSSWAPRLAPRLPPFSLEQTMDLPSMSKPYQPALEKLVREAEEARLEEALLETTGDELLDRAKAIAQAVEQQVRDALRAPDRQARQRPIRWASARPLPKMKTSAPSAATRSSTSKGGLTVSLTPRPARR